MDTSTLLTDDHVAELLAKEANDYSLRYSSMGLEAYRSSSRPSAKAKPNTRFLRNIIRETKNHNEALLAKEAAEAQARLDGLAAAKAREDRKRRPGAQDLRRRQLGAITATLQGRKRKIGDEGESPAKISDAKHRDTDGISARAEQRRHEVTESGKHSRRQDAEHEKARRHRRLDRSLSPTSGDAIAKASRRRDRSQSPDYKERRHRHSHRHSHRYRDRSISDSENPSDKRSSSHRKHRSDRHRDRDHSNNPSTSPPRSHRHRHREENQYDSDPLESLIGPNPPPPPKIRRKGRGAASGPSAMDSRFSEGYDPKSDIQPDSDLEGDDWADSLEALRDREKWRQQGAERLRAAGFTDEQIRGWEKSGREKGVEDVRWAKSGEGREWDRGKVAGGLDEDEGRLGWDK